jgi:peptidoglycan hydrolase-like protein with peptidoglycan-binding domain
MKYYFSTVFLTIIMSVGVYSTAHAQESDSEREALLAQIEQLTKLVQELQKKVEEKSLEQGTYDSIFTSSITLGSSNESVTLLQQVLASDPEVYPEAMITGYFGPLTRAALERFQRLWGLEPTGTFTDETRFVLARVLDNIPLDLQDAVYLQKSEVRDTIRKAISEFSISTNIVANRVALVPSQTFELGQKNSNIMALQQILATDPSIYPEQQISGIYTAATAEAVARLQARYSITVTARVDTETRVLLDEILRLNNAPTIQSGLLKKDFVAPAILINKRSREIISIVVTNDYREDNISARIEYEGGLVDIFDLFPETSSDKDTKNITVVKKRLATVLDRPLDTFSNEVTFTVVERPELPYVAVIKVAADRSLSAYLAFRQKGRVDIIVPMDLDMNYQVKFKGGIMTIAQAADTIVMDAIAGMPVDQELVDFVRKEAVIYYDSTEREVLSIPVLYEVDSSLQNGTQFDNGR